MESFPRNIDLHVHTNVSDGTDSPENLIYRVKEVGLSVFSVTDHDAIAGCAEVKARLKQGDPAFICGVEFSCEDALGKYHVLGYGYDDKAQSINDLVNLSRTLRLNRVRQRLDFIEKEFGFTFSKEDLNSLFATYNPGKPHIGNLMVKYGYAPSKEVAIKDFLNKYKGEEKHIAPETAIEAIGKAGGIPVLAHPSYGSGNELFIGEEMEKRLQRLIGFGIRGIEAFYSGFSKKIQSELLSFATKYNLYVTAGSDYHGTNKAVILGDTNFNEEFAYPEGLRAFLQNVNIVNREK